MTAVSTPVVWLTLNRSIVPDVVPAPPEVSLIEYSHVPFGCRAMWRGPELAAGSVTELDRVIAPVVGVERVAANDVGAQVRDEHEVVVES